MNWDAISAVGGIVSALAVLVTLIYLALQIRQSNDISRSSTSREIMSQFNEINLLIATDSSVRHLLLKEGDLSADETEQLYNFAIIFCNIWVSIQTAHDCGQVDAIFFAAGVKDITVEIGKWPNFRSAIEQWLTNYPEHSDYKIFEPVKEFG
jgi:hypothetical protein